MYASIYGKTVAGDGVLRDFAYCFSPLVEETAVNTAVIDVDGCELLFGSAYELAQKISGQATRPKHAGGVGTKINVALASNPDTAVYAARFLDGITFVSPGEELTCLGDLPVQYLVDRNGESKTKRAKARETQVVGPWTFDSAELDELFETLKIWGIQTFRDFAALPAPGVSERLGQMGVKLQQLAQGKTERQLKLKQAPPSFNQSIELDHAINQLEPLSFLLARLLNQICANLHSYALATNELTLTLKLENGSNHERKLNLPQPMRDPRVFLRLLLLDAEMHPPQSAILAITIKCEPVKPRVLQTGLFIPLAPEPEKLELTLARLVKLVGIDNVGSLELLDTHRPDAFRVKRFAIKDSRKKKTHRQVAIGKSQSGSEQSILGFRVFRPPLRALVQAVRGFPTEISAWGANRSVHGKVVRAAGPWRTTGDWWRVDRWARDEWDVAVESRSIAAARGSLYRIYRELGEGNWFVAGAYD